MEEFLTPGIVEEYRLLEAKGRSRCQCGNLVYLYCGFGYADKYCFECLKSIEGLAEYSDPADAERDGRFYRLHLWKDTFNIRPPLPDN